jgi:multiple sugar transport system permease protein
MSGSDRAIKIVQYPALALASVVTILPIVVIFLGSLKTGAEFNSTGPFDLPADFLNFDNYATAFFKAKMLLGFWNTFVLLAFSSAGTVLTGTMSAYVLHRFDFKLKGFVMLLFLWITLIPNITAQVATFQIVQGLGLYNTRAGGVILSMGTDIIAVYIFLQFLGSVPKSLDESAVIDGASYFRVYFQVVLPLLKPAVITVLIIKGIGLYNDFYMPFLYMPKQSLRVVSTALFTFKGPYGARWEVICAGVVIALLPTLALFIALQKQIYAGLVDGAVKQ